jgi:hypothetical protein
MSGGLTILSSDGVALPINNLAATMTYTGEFLATITVVYNGVTYVQTYTNDGTFITAISQWTPV